MKKELKWAIIVLVLATPFLISYYRYRQEIWRDIEAVNTVHQWMQAYDNVDKIVITLDNEILEFSASNPDFEAVRQWLYPFWDRRNGVPGWFGGNQSIQTDAMQRAIRIKYYVNESVLFEVNIYLAADTEDADLIRTWAFPFGGRDAFVLVHEGGWFGGFEADIWEILRRATY
ncbi:MAG: hypothetical protein FWC71_03920 [Defluviitaleaceae bacterium]|nr:hypothetical protein [Defluviitaleaceae bacterium]